MESMIWERDLASAGVVGWLYEIKCNFGYALVPGRGTEGG